MHIFCHIVFATKMACIGIINVIYNRLLYKNFPISWDTVQTEWQSELIKLTWCDVYWCWCVSSLSAEWCKKPALATHSWGCPCRSYRMRITCAMQTWSCNSGPSSTYSSAQSPQRTSLWVHGRIQGFGTGNGLAEGRGHGMVFWAEKKLLVLSLLNVWTVFFLLFAVREIQIIITCVHFAKRPVKTRPESAKLCDP